MPVTDNAAVKDDSIETLDARNPRAIWALGFRQPVRICDELSWKIEVKGEPRGGICSHEYMERYGPEVRERPDRLVFEHHTLRARTAISAELRGAGSTPTIPVTPPVDRTATAQRSDRQGATARPSEET